MTKKLIFIFCISIAFASCISKKIVTTWKAAYTVMPVHNRIVVVGIIKDDTDSLKTIIEDEIVEELAKLGYNAVSAFKEFGPGGLSDMTQGETFLKLCDENIDAVMTVALIDKLKQAKYQPKNYSASISYYYYNSIWNYKKVQADLSERRQSLNTSYMWEIILFDLNTLEPLSVIQTRPFPPGKEIKGGYVQKILEKMKKEKVLYAQTKKDPKPF